MTLGWTMVELLWTTLSLCQQSGSRVRWEWKEWYNAKMNEEIWLGKHNGIPVSLLKKVKYRVTGVGDSYLRWILINQGQRSTKGSLWLVEERQRKRKDDKGGICWKFTEIKSETEIKSVDINTYISLELEVAYLIQKYVKYVSYSMEYCAMLHCFCCIMITHI